MQVFGSCLGLIEGWRFPESASTATRLRLPMIPG